MQEETILLKKLNTAQRKAVTTTEGYVRVIAGAGSGKTRALSHRFAYLVNEIGILPGNILCVTFTNKSANEMRQRIHNLTGDNDTGYINTFHGFCVTVLQEDAHAVGYPKSFLVIDNADIDDMLRIVYEERGLSLRDMTFSQARNMIEMEKGVHRPGYVLDMIAMPLEVLKEQYERADNVKDIIFYGYLYQEKKCFALDYNDLIFFTLHIFEKDREIRLKWQQRLEYIMVDEFQDIDPPQYRLMEALSGYHKNLFVVGDPDQTIYTWRGANVRNLLEFDKKHPGTQTVLMTENYRSTPQILEAANSLIAANENRYPKDLVPVLKDGESVLVHFAENAAEEAIWIAQQMLVLKGKGVPYRDMTVLYRAHYVTRPVEEALLHADNQIPYTIYSGVPFFARLEIKDALCYLRMIALQDDLSFQRICNRPKRNLGKRRMRFLEQYAGEHDCTLYQALLESIDDSIFKGTKARQLTDLIERFRDICDEEAVSEVLAKILNESGYEEMLRTEGAQERLDNLAELKQSVFEYETTCGEEVTLIHYLNHIALFTNADAGTDKTDKVKLMTVHAAKGLEFPYVFLCGMNEGIFPARKTNSKEGMEEERRLAFVAVTRAKKRLFLSEAGGRIFDGSPRYPSRFLLDIDQSLLEYTQKPREGLIAETREYVTRENRFLLSEDTLTLFEKGRRVRHPVIGEGTILEINMQKMAYRILFDGMETPREITFRAKLTGL